MAQLTGLWRILSFNLLLHRLGNPSPPGVERSLAPWILERERGAALQIFWRAKRRRASLLPLLVHSTPWGKGNITIITLSPCCYWGIKLTFIPTNYLSGEMQRFDCVGIEGKWIFYLIFMSVLYARDVILEWSDGGIFLPLLFSERRDGVERKSILGGEGKWSSLLKFRTFSKSEKRQRPDQPHPHCGYSR